MSNTVITNYTDLNGPSTKADNSVVVIVNKDGSLSVDQALLGTLMGSDGAQAGISVVRVGHEGKPDDATDSENEDENIPHVTLSVDSYYNDPSSILKYDSGAEMLQSLRIETRENSLVGFHNDHCYTPLTSPGQSAPQKNDLYSGYNEPVIEIVHTPPPKPIPSTKKITILDQKIIPKGRKIPMKTNESPTILKNNDVLNKPLPNASKSRNEDKPKQQLKSDESSESSSISSGDSVPDRDSDSDYKETRERPGQVKKNKAKPRILKQSRIGKVDPKSSSKVKAGKSVLKQSIKDKFAKSILAEKKQTITEVQPVQKESVPEPQVTAKATPKPAKRDKKLPSQLSAALISDMTSLFTSPDVIRRVSTENKTSGKVEKEQAIIKDVKDDSTEKLLEQLTSDDKSSKSTNVKTYSKPKDKNTAGPTTVSDKVSKDYDLIPQIDDASLAQILQDTTATVSSVNKGQPTIATTGTINSLGLPGPLSPTLDLLGGLQPEEEGLTEDLLMHVAQLVESSENLKEVIDKQVLGKVDTPKISMEQPQTPFTPQTTLEASTTTQSFVQSAVSSKSVKVPQPKPIEIVRRDGRVITLPPIEAPATRSSKRKSQIEQKPEADVSSTATVAVAPVPPPPVLSPPSPPPYEPSEPQVMPVSKQYSNKKVLQKRQELEAQGPSVEKASAESQESWNSEDDPYRLWCICKQPHNNRFMICCDGCEDWFHGKCVSITKAMGQQMEEQGIEWRCPNCVNKTNKPNLTPKMPGTQLTNVNSGSPPKPPKHRIRKREHRSSSPVINPAAKNTDAEPLSSPPHTTPKTLKTGGCIVCKKPARASSIYCSDACILKHAQDSLGTSLTSPRPGEPGRPSEKRAPESRVIVYERKSGRLLAGPNAPTAENLKSWLQKNPTFEVVRPGTLSQIKPNLVRKSASSDQNKIQTTLNFEKIPKKQESHPSPSTSSQPQHPKESPAGGGNKVLTTPKQTKLLPMSRPHVSPRSAPPPSPKPLPSASKPEPEPKKLSRSSTRSSYDKAPSVSPVTSKRKEALEKRRDSTKKMDSAESIRDNVRKALQEQMNIRMNETKGIKCTEDEIQTFAEETEVELYELFKDVGMKYKAKYRSLMFNIKDRKNLSLWQKICDKSLTPKQLVRLSPEELASQELAEWRDQEAKHQLELIKKSELDLLAASKTYVLKTHKGEEVMETKQSVSTELDPNVPVEDVVSILNDTSTTADDDAADKEKEEVQSKSEEIKRRSSSRKKDKSDKDSRRDRDSKDSDERKSRTSKRKSEVRPRGERTTRRSSRRDRSSAREEKRSKSKEKESKEKESKERESKEKESKERESKEKDSKDRDSSEREKSRRRSRSRGKSRRRSKSRARRKSRSRSRSRDSRKRHRSRSKHRRSVEDKLKNRSRSQDNISKSKQDSPDSDSIERPKSAMQKEMHPEYDPHEPMITSAFSEEDLRKSREDIYEDSYKADMDYVEEYDPTKSYTIDRGILSPPSTSGKRDKLSEAESDQEPTSTVESAGATAWHGCVNMVDVARFYVAAIEVSGSSLDLEEDLSAELDIVGRINPDTVWDYIGKMKRTSNKDIVILRLQAANDEEKMQYIALYSYLSSRNRLGVVKVSNTNTVKDFYIVPLSANTTLPSVLLPLDGPGLGEVKTHLLLAIVIRLRKKRTASIPHDVVPAKVARESRKRSYTPPISSRVPLPGTYTSPALSSSVKDKIAASLVSADDDEPYSPTGSASSGGSAADSAAGALRSKVEELNRQIEEQKMHIRKIVQADSSIDLPAGGEEAYSPSRPMTPPMPLADISLPSNLQEILATIKQRSEGAHDVDMRTLPHV